MAYWSVNGETVDLSGTGHVGDKSVGSDKVFADLGSLALSNGTDGNGGLAGNYTLAGGTDTLSITKKALGATATVSDRVYDSTKLIDLVGAGLVGLVSGDHVTLDDATEGTFADKNVGTNKAVTTSMSISGTDADNYDFTTLTGLTASVTPKAIDVTATVANKVYDTTTGAMVNSLSSSGVIGSDVVNFGSGSADFADANAANGKTVTVDGLTKSGTDAGNYVLNSTTTTTTADITPYVLGLSSTRVYDGTVNAAASLFGVSGVLTGLNGQTVNLSGTGHVGDKSVGSDKVFADLGSLALSNGTDGNGGLAGNYTLAGGTDTLSITKKALGATATVSDRVYDSTKLIDLVGAGLVGLVSGDHVTLDDATEGTFADKNVGTNKAVTTSMSISGTDADNYDFTTLTGLTASVTPKAIDVTATVANKVYDTTTGATVNSLSSSGVIGSDVVNFDSGSADFADANAANGKTVTIDGLTKSGTDAGNYVLNSTTTTTTADITPYVLGLSSTRVYDGTVNAAASLFGGGGVLTGLNGQTVNLSGTGHVGDKNVGSHKVFADLGSLALSNGTDGNGGLAGNYTLAGGTDTLSITPKAIGVSATGVNKMFDGNTHDIVVLGSGYMVAGDALQFGSGTANFSNPNVGNDKLVTVRGVWLSGADAGNYVLDSTTTTTHANVTGARSSAFGISDGLQTHLSSTVAPFGLDTPYGLAAQQAVGDRIGNKERLHHPVERNVSRGDFTSGMALRVVDGGVRMPVRAMP